MNDEIKTCHAVSERTFESSQRNNWDHRVVSNERQIVYGTLQVCHKGKKEFKKLYDWGNCFGTRGSKYEQVVND